jgi:mono/diheme cytochrome c family protein
MNHSVCSVFLIVSLVGACSSSTPASPQVTGYRIVSGDGSPSTAVAGEAKRLAVVQVMADGTTVPLSASTRVTWSGPPLVKALSIGSAPPSSILPVTGRTATAMWIQNPDHFSDDELEGVLWVLDSGTDPQPTVVVMASLSSSDFTGGATANINIGPMPDGDAGRGQAVYESNCASCHGSTGQGTMEFPGLNNTPDHVAGDPSWNASLLAMTARSDMDDLGVSLDPSMPKWLTRPSSTGRLLSPSDFADIYAFLKTQTQ